MLLWYAQDVEIFYFHMFAALTNFNHMIGPLRMNCLLRNQSDGGDVSLLKF